MQLYLESGTICQPISDCWTCHSAFRQSLKTFLFGLWYQSTVTHSDLEILLFTDAFTYSLSCHGAVLSAVMQWPTSFEVVRLTTSWKIFLHCGRLVSGSETTSRLLLPVCGWIVTCFIICVRANYFCICLFVRHRLCRISTKVPRHWDKHPHCLLSYHRTVFIVAE